MKSIKKQGHRDTQGKKDSYLGSSTREHRGAP